LLNGVSVSEVQGKALSFGCEYPGLSEACLFLLNKLTKYAFLNSGHGAGGCDALKLV
jgi:hypothetical protein